MIFNGKITLGRTASEILEIEVEDETSGLKIIAVRIPYDTFARFITREVAQLPCNAEVGNTDKIGKVRNIITKDYPSGIYGTSDKNKWIEENTPEGYIYWSNSNYGRTAIFMAFVDPK